MVAECATIVVLVAVVVVVVAVVVVVTAVIVVLAIVEAAAGTHGAQLLRSPIIIMWNGFS